MIRWLLPQGTDPAVAPVFLARALRGFADGFVAVLLPVYLIALGLGSAEVSGFMRNGGVGACPAHIKNVSCTVSRCSSNVGSCALSVGGVCKS